MSLEQQIERLNSNLERIYGAGGFAAAEAAGAKAGAATETTTTPTSTDAAPAGGKPGRKPSANRAPQPTLEDVKAAAFAVKDKLGQETAKAIIANHGAAALVKLDPKKYVAFIAECNAELEREPGEDEAPAEDDL